LQQQWKELAPGGIRGHKGDGKRDREGKERYRRKVR